ncbi:uncharacterized protein LOC121235387 [Juglans microcarpa x Juglans regia]|uniref:uncharacterized protein LOC121235387 n=1 Tax=Juglans microcarpa x Juglans regia TaxID=2249226 RepID=UPI001B7F3D85|nr:uncharacterized protein LOC121235387 [Juglans microcarpa x Juglans regia]
MVSFQETNNTSQTYPMQAAQRVHKWLKPVEGYYKAQWDATLSVGICKIGAGVIIRDHQGQVIGALRASRWLKGRPFDAEAHGLLLAALFCKEMGLMQVILKGDLKQVVDLLQKQVSNWSMGGLLIEDAQNLMNSCSQWSATHTYREANKVVHYLAKFALNLPEDVYDIEECPFGIQSIVNIEML